MIPNLFDVPWAIFYRKRYKDKQSSVLCAERRDQKNMEKAKLCGFEF